MSQPVPKPIPLQTADDGKVIGRLHDEAIPIYIHEPVLEAILDFSEQDLRRELGGFLVGGVHEDDGQYVEVRHFVPALNARSAAGQFVFTHDSWSTMRRHLEDELPGEVPVGWQHTHPNLGVFLSEYDKFIHRNYFSQPWQIALVVDPVRQELEFFQWREDRIVDCGFICVSQD